MRYKQKNPYAFLRFFIYAMSLSLITGIGIITYTVYKRNLTDTSQPQCTTATDTKVAVSGSIKQVLPIDKHTVMIVTGAENGAVNTIIYDHCSNNIVRQFSMRIPSESSISE